MNITVKVDDVTLDTVVADVFGYDAEDGEPYKLGNKTLADLVATQVVERLVKHERWNDLTRTVFEVRREVMRELVTPSVEKAIAEPLRKTNIYGEATGEATTLREVIVDEARKVINAKDPNDYRNEKGTLLVRLVREEVANALRKEIKDAVQQAKAFVADEIGKQVASAVTAAMKGR